MDSPDFQALVDLVKRETNLVDLIRERVELQPSGSVWKGRSPRHRDSTPSLCVWEDSGRWKDYAGGGQAGGDCFEWLRYDQGMAFWDALLFLAARAGIDTPSDPALAKAVADHVEQRSLWQVLGLAADFHAASIPDEIREGVLIRHYGFSEEAIASFRVGFAPGDSALWNHLTRDLGVEPELALGTGLFRRGQSGEVVDFFNRRIVFPYIVGGSVRYMAGRKTELTPPKPWEEPKYKKIPLQSTKRPYVSGFIRNDWFYNEDAARDAEVLLITEGFADVVSAAQSGLACIAPATTSFSPRDYPRLLSLVQRARQVVICNDSEENGSGDRGAQATADFLADAGVDVRVATLPRPEGVQKVDVNDFVKANGAEAFQDLIGSAPHLLDMLIDQLPVGVHPAELMDAVRPILLRLLRVDPITQDQYLRRLQARSGLGQRVLQSALKDLRRSARRAEQEGAPSGRPDRFALRGSVTEGKGQYLYEGEEGPVAVTSFILKPTRRLQLPDDEIVCVDAHTDRGLIIRDLRFRQIHLSGKREFVKALHRLEFQFSGSDDSVQGIKRCLAKYRVPTIVGTPQVGLVFQGDERFWVGPAGINAAPGRAAPLPAIEWVPSDTSIGFRLEQTVKAREDHRALASRVLPALLLLNDPAVTIPVLGWFVAALSKPALMKLHRAFPILWVAGTQGSGKTSLLTEIMWRIVGAVDTAPYDAGASEFTLMATLSSTNAFPVLCDEYKPGDMPPQVVDRFHRLVRQTYGGEVMQKGLPSLGMVRFPLDAPLAVMGEALPTEPALMERLVAVLPNKNALEQSSEFKKRFAEVVGLDLVALARPLIQYGLSRDIPADLDHARARVDQILEGRRVPTRVRHNLSIVIVGLTHLAGFARECGVTLDLREAPSALLRVVTEMINPGGSVKDGLGTFLERCSAMAINGHLEHGRQFAVVDGVLRLHVPSAIEVYRRIHRQSNDRTELLDETQIRTLIRENLEAKGFVVSVSAQRELAQNERPMRVVLIDLHAAQQHLQLDGFAGDFECELREVVNDEA